MPVMQPLFILPPVINPRDYLPEAEVQKLSGFRLSSAPNSWADEVLQTLLRDHAYVPADRATVFFRKRDDAAGNAVGHVGFIGQPTVTIPVVIKDRELAPLDVMISRTTQNDASSEGVGDMSEDLVMPLNEQNLLSSLENKGIGNPVNPSQIHNTGITEDGSALRMPFRGRTVLASYLGAADTKKEQLRQFLAESKEAAAGFLIHGTDSVVQAWLDAEPPKNSIQAKLASTALPSSPAKFISGDALPVAMDPNDTLAAHVVLDDGQVKAATFAQCFDLQDPRRSLSTVALFEDGTFASVGTEVIAYNCPDEAAGAAIQKIASTGFKRGDYVMFHLPESHAFTAPAKIAGIVADAVTSSMTLTLADDLGHSVKVTIDPRIKTAMVSGGQWIFPTNCTAFTLTGASGAKPASVDKVAEGITALYPDKLTCSGALWSMDIHGVPAEVGLSESKVASVLSKWCSNYEDLMAEAKVRGELRFASEIGQNYEETLKLAEKYTAIPESASKIVDELAMPMDKAVKLAASLSDPASVDAVLGTGILTQDNLMEFVGLAEDFQDVVGKLARLLLAIRLGFPGDEVSTAVAMKSLQRVVEYLRSATQEVEAA
jgi:hypothetical protein